MAQPYSGGDVVQVNSIDVENAQLRDENEALRWRMQEIEAQNTELQQRLEDGRHALVVLAAAVLGESKEDVVRRWIVRTPLPSAFSMDVPCLVMVVLRWWVYRTPARNWKKL